MSRLRIVFMGTPDFAVPCLNMLVHENYDVAAVVTQPDRPKGRGQKVAASAVKIAALHHDLPVLQPKRIKDEHFQAEMVQLKPDLIIVVAFGQFLPQVMLDMPKYGCVNVHASLLPKYRGAAPIHWAVINGEPLTGVTTMYMDSGMDTGDMLVKADIPIGLYDTTGDVHDKLKDLGAQVLKETISLLISGKASRIPQDHALATHAPLLTRETERINWSDSATAIHNLVRGLNPWPVAHCFHNRKMLKIWTTTILKNSYTGTPGRIHALVPEGIVVETGEGLIQLLTVQPESKRCISAQDYMCGYHLNVGELLE